MESSVHVISHFSHRVDHCGTSKIKNLTIKKDEKYRAECYEDIAIVLFSFFSVEIPSCRYLVFQS